MKSNFHFYPSQFQNRRMKWRNSKERELLASGGSRDQTLPNKNNPNPDLSDAKTDRQPSVSPPSSISPSNNDSQPPQHQQMCSMRSPSDQQNKTSPVDQKFMVKKPADLKYEIDEMNSRSSIPASAGVHPPIGQLFNNFYDNQSSDGSVKAYGSQNNSMYYDEYDSNDSDDSEEINVTWLPRPRLSESKVSNWSIHSFLCSDFKAFLILSQASPKIKMRLLIIL